MLCSRQTHLLALHSLLGLYLISLQVDLSLVIYLQNQINNYKQTTKSTVCVNNDYTTGCNAAVIQFCGNKSAKFPGKSWHITEQFYDFAQP